MNGDIDGYPSESEADLALVSLLSFWTQDSDQILRIVRQSRLWDEKWERKDYQKRTIKFALENSGERYAWQSTSISIKETKREAAAESKVRPVISAPQFSLAEYMPPPGFLRDYVKYMLPTTEAPAQYHLFSGVIIVATIVGHKIYYIAGRRKFCNFWVIDVGPSGCKKSTCVDSSMQMLSDFGFGDYIYPVQVTPERLIPMLETKSAGTFFLSEMGASYDQWLSKTYASDMVSILTSLFDGGYFSRELKGEKYRIESSCVSILCGCTPTWLKEKLKKSDISIGFWPRFLFIPATRREKYLPIPPEGDPLLRDVLREKLLRIQEAFSSDEPKKINFDMVKTIYDPWYTEINKAADEDVANPYAASFVIRLSDYVKKLAAIVEVSSSQTVNIQPATMEYAIKLANWLRVAAIRVVATVTRDQLSEIEQRVFDVVSQTGNGGMTHTDLRHRLANYSKSQIDTSIASLEDSGDIKIVVENKSGPGRRGRRYIAIGSGHALIS